MISFSLKKTITETLSQQTWTTMADKALPDFRYDDPFYLSDGHLSPIRYLDQNFASSSPPSLSNDSLLYPASIEQDFVLSALNLSPINPPLQPVDSDIPFTKQARSSQKASLPREKSSRGLQVPRKPKTMSTSAESKKTPVQSSGQKKKSIHWTDAELRTLHDHRNADWDFDDIAEKLPGRTSLACAQHWHRRQRWMHKLQTPPLHPSLLSQRPESGKTKKHFTADEDDIIKSLHMQGRRHEDIVAQLEGRSELSVAHRRRRLGLLKRRKVRSGRVEAQDDGGEASEGQNGDDGFDWAGFLEEQMSDGGEETLIEDEIGLV